MTKNYRNTVIDTSALMAFFYKETGWEAVAEYMPRSVISAVNLAEVIKIFIEYQEISKELAIEYVHKAVERVIPFDQQQAGITGELSILTRKYGLSLGDRACIATGISTGFPIITADKVWKDLNLEHIEIILIR